MERPKILLHPNLCYPHPLIGRVGRLYIKYRPPGHHSGLNKKGKHSWRVPATLLEIGSLCTKRDKLMDEILEFFGGHDHSFKFCARVMDELHAQEVWFVTSGNSKRWWWLKENNRGGQAQLMWLKFKEKWTKEDSPPDFQWYEKPFTVKDQ